MLPNTCSYLLLAPCKINQVLNDPRRRPPDIVNAVSEMVHLIRPAVAFAQLDPEAGRVAEHRQRNLHGLLDLIGARPQRIRMGGGAHPRGPPRPPGGGSSVRWGVRLSPPAW